MIQERILRYVNNNCHSTCSYGEFLDIAKLTKLHIRREKSMSIKFFKNHKSIVPPVLNNLSHNHGTKYNFRYSNLLQISNIKTTNY